MVDRIQERGLAPLSKAMTQVAMETKRAMNREKFAGSGWEHFGKHIGAGGFPIVNQGLNGRTNDGPGNQMLMGRTGSGQREGLSKTNEPVIQMAGFTVHVDALNNTGASSAAIKFPEAPTGAVTYDSATGTVVEHADAATAFAAETATNQVVTRRVDMWGFQLKVEEVTNNFPIVPANGLTQSQATTIDGITTVVDNSRPIDYFEVFEGDTTSRGRGVNFFTATDAQKEILLNNPKNNLYRLDDGSLNYASVTQKTFAGSGNGDWDNVIAATGDPLRFDTNSPIMSPAGQPYLAVDDDSGLFADGTGYYFLVGGTVSRLAQGAYHPEHNSFGAMQFRNDANDANVNWNGAGLTGITSQLLCFTRAASGTGAIGQTSGRTNDRRLFNAIYADGLGGIVDYRWSANDRSDPKWGAQAKLEAEAGDYRGLDKLVRTTIASDTLIVTEIELDVSVSGDFSNPVIVGTPASVLARFPTGFEGRLLATQPTGSISSFSDTIRKHKSQGNALRWNGAAWASFSPTFNIGTNTWTLTNEPAANVVIFSAVNWASPTSRSTNTAVLNTQNGHYGVTATASSFVDRAIFLFESMLGKVATSTSTADGLVQIYPFTVLNFNQSSSTFEPISGRESQHAPLMLAVPTNNSRGIKYATHQVNDNGQATLNFIFNELDHNGTDWGDDDRLRVLNGTYTNQNGVTGLAANVNTLAIAYGLIKNEV